MYNFRPRFNKMAGHEYPSKKNPFLGWVICLADEAIGLEMHKMGNIEMPAQSAIFLF
jgi:hypothetical protein